MKKYSIIIPCHNAVDFIDECLDSIQALDKLSDREYEIICAIDGCEKTLEHFKTIIEKYPQLKVFYSAENNGTYITNNFLVSQTKYQDIIKFDADDIMAPHLLTSIEQYPDAKYIMLRGQTFKDKLVLPCKSQRSPFGGVWYAKKEVFNIIGGFKSWRCAADSDMMDRLRKAGTQIITIKDSVFYRRVHEDSLTHHVDTRFGSPLRQKYCRELGKGPICISPESGNFKPI